MTENLAGRGEGLAGLVAKLAERWEAVSKYTSDRGYKTALLSCAGELRNTAEAAAPPSTAPEHVPDDLVREILTDAMVGTYGFGGSLTQARIDIANRIDKWLVARNPLATPSPQAPREQFEYDCPKCQGTGVGSFFVDIGGKCPDCKGNKKLIGLHAAATQEQPAGSGAPNYISCATCGTTMQANGIPGTLYCPKCQPGSPRKVGEDGALTETQVEDIHKIIERHSTDVIDYELATDDINAYLSRSVPVGEQKQEEGV